MPSPCHSGWSFADYFHLPKTSLERDSWNTLGYPLFVALIIERYYLSLKHETPSALCITIIFYIHFQNEMVMSWQEILHKFAIPSVKSVLNCYTIFVCEIIREKLQHKALKITWCWHYPYESYSQSVKHQPSSQLVVMNFHDSPLTSSALNFFVGFKYIIIYVKQNLKRTFT